MNILLIVVVVFFVMCMINGTRKGLIRSLFSCGASILALILTINCYHFVGRALNNYTPIESNIQAYVVSSLQIQPEKETQKIDRTKQTELISGLNLPKGVKNALIENNNKEIYQALDATGFYEYIGRYLAEMAVNGIAFLSTYLIVWIILRFLLKILDFMTELPILKGLNRIGGTLLGMIEGLLGIWLLFLIITILGSTAFGKAMYASINDSVLLSLLFDNNYLLIFLTGMSKLLF